MSQPASVETGGVWWADKDEAAREYGVSVAKLEEVKDADCVIVAVAHDEFKKLSLDDIKSMFHGDDCEKVLIDVKGLYSIKDLEKSGMKFWRL